jgi:hypothetical protein
MIDISSDNSHQNVQMLGSVDLKWTDSKLSDNKFVGL